MRSQYERGDEGKRAILEVTSPIPLDNFSRVELDFIARAALDMQDPQKLEAVLDVSGNNKDGNLIRLSLVCGLLQLKGNWKEARAIPHPWLRACSLTGTLSSILPSTRGCCSSRTSSKVSSRMVTCR